MADMTDSAFCRTVRSVILRERQRTKDLGDSSSPSAPQNDRNVIVFREMVSSEAVVRGNNKTLDMTDIHPDERPIVQQVFGSNPEVMAEAARIIEEEHHPEGFDINMGCPVYKVVHNFNGAALMQDAVLATKIIQAMKNVISVPLSVKIRAGWSDPTECLEFSKKIEAAGADLITIHGRTKMQAYTGKSDWEIIKQMKEGVSIPVLANGDIHTPHLTFNALDQTKCDGVLIARGALGNPWIFSQIEEMLEGKEPTQVTLDERISTVKQHLDFHIEQYGERGVVTFRKHMSWYFRGIDGAKKFKQRLHTSSTREEVHDILDKMRIDGLRNDALSTRDALHPQAKERVYMAK